MSMNIADWLCKTARRDPKAPALFIGTVCVADYAEFARRVSSLAEALAKAYSLKAGDRVGIFMKNRVEYLETLYAVLWLGAVVVPINAKLHGKEVAWVLENADARLVVVSDDIGAGLDTAALHKADTGILSVDSTSYEEFRQRSTIITPPVARNSDDLAWLFYTSGTTGRPKGVMLSHGNITAMSLCYPKDVDPVAPEDGALYAAPISHGSGLYNFIHVYYGARHVVPVSGGFKEQEVLDLAQAMDNISMFAAPTMVKRLVDAAKARGMRGDGIKTIIYGGGPMYLADIEEALEQMGPRFVQIFGQGESPMTITALARSYHSDTDHPRYRERLASVGRAHSIVDVRVVEDNEQVAPPGTVGEIEVRGPTVMLGYWRNPEATKEAVRGGWLRTGDLGVLDEDGFLTLRDRSKDVIISGGTNIYPREVEEALLTHPDVAEVSVLGQPDPDWGEVVVACVVMVPGADLDRQALDEHCLSLIARFKRPKIYYAFEALPKNNNGKVVKTALRALIAKKK